MAYARIWSKAVPVGGDAASLIWQFIENVREDTEDRMSTLVTGWSTGAPTDPIVPLPFIKGNVTGKTVYYGAGSWQANNLPTFPNAIAWSNLSGTDLLGNNDNTTAVINRIFFNLPIGSILQNVKVLGQLGNAVARTMSFKVFRSPFVGAVQPTGVQLGSTANFVANGNWQVIAVGGAPLAHTVLTANCYFVEVTWSGANGQASLGQVEITYDTVDSTTLL